MSLTTTTIRTYGSFQLISTKTTPIRAPPPKKKQQQPSQHKKASPRVANYASSMQSLESDLDSVLEEEDSFYYNSGNPNHNPPSIYISDDNTSSTLASGKVSTTKSRPKSSTPQKQLQHHQHHRISFSPVPSTDDESVERHEPPSRSLSPMKPALKSGDHSRNASVSSNIDDAGGVYLTPSANSVRRQSRVSFSSNDAINEYNARNPPNVTHTAPTQITIPAAPPPSNKYSYEIIVPSHQQQHSNNRHAQSPAVSSSKPGTTALAAAAVSAAKVQQHQRENEQSERRKSVANANQVKAAAATSASRTGAPAARSKVLANKPVRKPSITKQQTKNVAPSKKQALTNNNPVPAAEFDDSSSGHSIYSDASDYPLPLDEITLPLPSSHHHINNNKNNNTTNLNHQPQQQQQQQPKNVTVAAANFASQKHQQKPQTKGPNVEAAAAARSSSIRNVNGMAIPPSPLPPPNNSKHTARPTSPPPNRLSVSGAAAAGASTMPTSHSYRALIHEDNSDPYAAVQSTQQRVSSLSGLAGVNMNGGNTNIPHAADPNSLQHPHHPTMHKLQGKYDDEEGVYDPELDENQPAEYNEEEDDEFDDSDAVSMRSDSSWKRERAAQPARSMAFRNTLRGMQPAMPAPGDDLSDSDSGYPSLQLQQPLQGSLSATSLSVINESAAPAPKRSSFAPPKGSRVRTTKKKVSYPPEFFESTRNKQNSVEDYMGLERTLSNSSFDNERRKGRPKTNGTASKFAFHSLRSSKPAADPHALLPAPEINSGRTMSLTVSSTRSSFAAADGPPQSQPFRSRIGEDSDSDYEGVISKTLKNTKAGASSGLARVRRASFSSTHHSVSPTVSATRSPKAAPPAQPQSPRQQQPAPPPQKPHGFLATLRKEQPRRPDPVVLETQLTPPQLPPQVAAEMHMSPPASPTEKRKQSKLGALFAKRQHIVDMQQQRYFEKKTLRSQSITSATPRPTVESGAPFSAAVSSQVSPPPPVPKIPVTVAEADIAVVTATSGHASQPVYKLGGGAVVSGTNTTATASTSNLSAYTALSPSQGLSKADLAGGNNAGNMPTTMLIDSATRLTPAGPVRRSSAATVPSGGRRASTMTGTKAVTMTSASPSAAAAAEIIPDIGVTPKKKKFGGLRKVFGLN